MYIVSAVIQNVNDENNVTKTENERNEKKEFPSLYHEELRLIQKKKKSYIG